MSGGRGTLVVIAVAVIGMGVTIGTHRTPGYLLGGFILAGTIIAGLAVRPGSGYLLIPAPALAYLVTAVGAGLIHEHSAGPSRSGLTVGVTQWIADGFIAMAAATALAGVLALIGAIARRRARPPSLPPEPEAVVPARPGSRTVFPSGPDSASWALPRPDQRTPEPGPEPPSWPWPEEPVPHTPAATGLEPAPRTERFTRPPGGRPRPDDAPRRPAPPAAGRPDPPSQPLRPPSWLDHPSGSGPQPFGGLPAW